MRLPGVRKFQLGAYAAFVLMITMLGIVFICYPDPNKQSPVVNPRFDRLKSTMHPFLAAKLETMRRYISVNETATPHYPVERLGRYLMLNPDLCRGVDEIHVIIVVHTSPDHFVRRQRIRETFGQESLFLPFRVRVAFILGQPVEENLFQLLKLEHAIHNDTVMGDFIDDYRNLSLKGVLWYRWVSQHCANSKFVLKIDDDVVVNMYKLLYSFLHHMTGMRKSLFCNIWDKGGMTIYREGTWGVDQRVFPVFDSYPFDYCSGFVVIMTTDLTGPLFEAAMTTPFFWIDDVYLFGMLPGVVGGVTYYNYAEGDNITFKEEVAINCTRTWGLECPIFASLISDENFWDYWALIKNVFTSSSWRVLKIVVL